MGFGRNRRFIRATMTYMDKATKNKLRIIFAFAPLNILERNLDGDGCLLYKKYLNRVVIITMIRVARIMVMINFMLYH